MKISKANEIITEVINKHISPDSDRKRMIGHYNCSEIGTCFRQWYWRYTNPKPIDNEKLRIFHIGNILHTWINELFENSKDIEVKGSEKSLLLIDSKSGIVLHGRLDNQVVIDGEEMIIDTKTTAKITSYPVNIEYKMQLMPYLKAFGLKKGAILYVEKNTLVTKLVIVDYSDKMLNEVFNRMNIIHKALVDKKLPKPEAKKSQNTKWKCKYCEYKEECDKNDENQIKVGGGLKHGKYKVS